MDRGPGWTRRLRIGVKRWLASRTLVMEFCRDCGNDVEVVWTADDGLWAKVSGNPDGGGILCIPCFDLRATDMGLFIRWVPQVEEPY